MSLTVAQETFDSLTACWLDRNRGLRWNSIFVLPAWLKVWWQELGSGGELYLGAVRSGDEIIGIAPLFIRDNTASIIGSSDVCDYLDFIISPGAEKEFFSTLLDHLTKKGISELDLRPVRPDSTVMTDLAGIARDRGYPVSCSAEDVSLELDLPASWEEYLEILTTKQRHEVRRKLRRLVEAGKVGYYALKDSQLVSGAMDSFLSMFTESRFDKATFLTAQMESFFRSLAGTMAGIGLLELGVLELDGRRVAMTMGFDYGDSLYLYNSAYEPDYRSLSVGLLSKVLSIRDKIAAGKKRFDFLKGNEAYKHHLGGREVPLYSCRISIR